MTLPRRMRVHTYWSAQKQQQSEETSDSDDSSDSDKDEEDEDEDDSDDPTGVDALITAERKQAGDKARAERKAKKAADKVEAARMADQRRKKEVNLNNVSSISGFGGGGTRKSPGMENVECYKCGGKGHMKNQCPQKDGWKRKRGPA